MSQYKWAILQNGHFYFCYFLKFYFDADPSILLLVTVFLHCGTAIFFTWVTDLLMPLPSLCSIIFLGGQLVHANRLVCAYEKYNYYYCYFFSTTLFLFFVILLFNLTSNYPGELQTPVWIIQCVFFLLYIAQCLTAPEDGALSSLYGCTTVCT